MLQDRAEIFDDVSGVEALWTCNVAASERQQLLRELGATLRRGDDGRARFPVVFR